MFRLLRYRFSIRLCAVCDLTIGNRLRGFEGRDLRGRVVDFGVSALCLVSDEELAGDEAMLGAEMVGELSS